MKRHAIVALAMVLAVAALVIPAQKPHQFSADECLICHTGEKGGRDNLRPDVTGACAACHPSARNYQAHPTDLLPKMRLPGDMLLVDGLFTCVSCHDVHAHKGAAKGAYFLRRNVSGKPFCLICHDVDDRGHLFIGATHGGQFRVSDATTRVDPITLLCIECHDDRIDSLAGAVGAGTWSHFSGRLNHPIGVSYRDSYRNKPHAYVPPGVIREEVELFDGKIGCGTCHNRFAGKNFMLVMSNERSRLCFSCHIT